MLKHEEIQETWSFPASFPGGVEALSEDEERAPRLLTGRNRKKWLPIEEVGPQDVLGPLPVSIRIQVMDPWERLGLPMDAEYKTAGASQLAFVPANYWVK